MSAAERAAQLKEKKFNELLNDKAHAKAEEFLRSLKDQSVAQGITIGKDAEIYTKMAYVTAYITGIKEMIHAVENGTA